MAFQMLFNLYKNPGKLEKYFLSHVRNEEKGQDDVFYLIYSQ